jgi:hypothetical protein
MFNQFSPFSLVVLSTLLSAASVASFLAWRGFKNPELNESKPLISKAEVSALVLGRSGKISLKHEDEVKKLQAEVKKGLEKTHDLQVAMQLAPDKPKVESKKEEEKTE